MKVGYLGPEGTYTYEMAQTLFPNDVLIPFSPLSRVVRAVDEGIVERGVVPFENIKEGLVLPMVDALVRASRTHIVAESWLPIPHALGALQETSLADVRTIYSHPQALAQSTEALDTLLQDYEIIETGSTAGAAGKIMNGRLRNSGAIASVSALQREGLAVLVENLVPRNRTRFATISTERFYPLMGYSRQYKMLISIDALPDYPGSLDRHILAPLLAQWINKQSIQSRPNGRGGYRFIIEIDTHLEASAFQKTFQDMIHSLDPDYRRTFKDGFKIQGVYLDSHWKE